MSLWADASTREALAASLATWPSHALTPDQTALLLRLLDGIYAPLDTFPHQSGPHALAIARQISSRNRPNSSLFARGRMARLRHCSSASRAR